MRFKSGTAILDMFGLAKGGKEYRRVVAGLERIFAATIFFGTESNTGVSRVVERARFNFIQHARIWYQGGEDNLITLSPEFFEEVQRHPIPTDLDVARLLANSPGAFDLYVWLRYRSFTRSSASIPLFGPAGLAAQLGCADYSRTRKFRSILRTWLTQVRLLWPDCPAFLETTHLRLEQNCSTLKS